MEQLVETDGIQQAIDSHNENIESRLCLLEQELGRNATIGPLDQS